MKKTLTILSVALVALMLSSCVEKSKKYQQLLEEKEALILENQNIEKEYNEALGVIRDVENNLQALQELEDLLLLENESLSAENGALSAENGTLVTENGVQAATNLSQREKFSEQLVRLKSTLEVNRKQLDSLSVALENSNKDRTQLSGTINRLRAQLAEKEAKIVALQEQLAQKDEEIAGLNTQVAALNEDLTKVNAEKEEQSRIIADQITELNTVYYVGAKKKELKASGILSSRRYILKQEVPADAFTKADKRELQEIVFETKKAKVLSAHPTESYTIVVKDKSTSVLQITNPDLFWSVTKYLVVVTK